MMMSPGGWPNTQTELRDTYPATMWLCKTASSLKSKCQTKWSVYTILCVMLELNFDSPPLHLHTHPHPFPHPTPPQKRKKKGNLKNGVNFTRFSFLFYEEIGRLHRRRYTDTSFRLIYRKDCSISTFNFQMLLHFLQVYIRSEVVWDLF